MASTFKISILVVTILAACSANSIRNSFSDSESSSVAFSGSLGDDDLLLGDASQAGFPEIESAGLASSPLLTLDGDSTSEFAADDSLAVDRAPKTSDSSHLAHFHKKTASEARRERLAAEKYRKQARAQAQKSSARFEEIRKGLDRRDAEAQMRTQSAAVHLAKANAAAERKVKAAAEEKTERKAARRDEDISKQIREKSALTLASAEKEADDMDKEVARLNREADEHEAKARAAMARAAALASSVQQQNQAAAFASQSSRATSGTDSSQFLTVGAEDYGYASGNDSDDILGSYRNSALTDSSAVSEN